MYPSPQRFAFRIPRANSFAVAINVAPAFPVKRNWYGSTAGRAEESLKREIGSRKRQTKIDIKCVTMPLTPPMSPNQARLGQPITTSNFRSDVNGNGVINASDSSGKIADRKISTVDFAKNLRFVALKSWRQTTGSIGPHVGSKTAVDTIFSRV